MEVKYSLLELRSMAAFQVKHSPGPLCETGPRCAASQPQSRPPFSVSQVLRLQVQTQLLPQLYKVRSLNKQLFCSSSSVFISIVFLELHSVIEMKIKTGNIYS